MQRFFLSSVLMLVVGSSLTVSELQDCDSPPPIVDGDFKLVPSLNAAIYTCNSKEGFVLQGTQGADSAVIRCSNGTWDSVNVSCAKVECTSPPPTLDKGSHDFDTKFRDRGCRYNRLARPRSSAICKQDLVPYYGQSVEYTCNDGYVLENSSDSKQLTSTCMQDGRWSSLNKTCETLDCGAPPDLNGMQANYTVTSYRSRAEYFCAPGYRTRPNRAVCRGDLCSPPSFATCQEDGSWSKSQAGFTCEPIDCGRSPDGIRATKMEETGTLYNDLVKYRCLLGYRFKAHGSSKCQADGTWSEAPSCILVDCGEPPAVSGGGSISTGSGYHATTTYSCQHGYKMVGLSTITCTSNGTWSEAPLCQKIRCGEPPRVSHSSILVLGFYFKDVASYKCDVGFDLLGNANSTCEIDGFWTAPPECARVTCGPPPNVTNAVILSMEGLKFGNSISYECLAGYNKEKNITRIFCQLSGEWTTAPECK